MGKGTEEYWKEEGTRMAKAGRPLQEPRIAALESLVAFQTSLIDGQGSRILALEAQMEELKQVSRQTFQEPIPVLQPYRSNFDKWPAISPVNQSRKP